MQTVVFSPFEDHQIQFDKESTFVISDSAKLQQTLEILRDSKFTLFQAEVQDPQVFTLKVLSQIVRILAVSGHLKVTFRDVSQENFEKIIQLLAATGMENENQSSSSSMSNQISFVKKVWGQSASISKPQQQKQQPQQQQQQQQQVNDKVTGQYNFEKVIEIVPEKKEQQQQEQPAKPANPFEKFDLINNNNQVFDENDLLKNDKVEVKPVAEKKAGGCAPKGCKNCTCGKKAKAQGATPDELLKQLEAGDIKSSCGNCYLGDAFRCASCPYKGLPAFKPGEKVQLDLQSNDAVFNNGEDNGEIQVSNTGKITLDL